MEELREDIDQNLVDELQGELEDKLSAYGIDESTVLAEARQNLLLWDGYNSQNVVRGKDDMRFVLQDQWSALERSEFSRLFKLPLTFNKSYDPIKKLIGDRRKNKPDLMVRSLTGRSTQQDITLRSDLVRTFCYQSQNDLVYQQAFACALLMGWGAFEVCVDYEGPRSFYKTIRLDLIEDPSKASFDPNARKPHKGDGNYCARHYEYSKEEFHATFPHIIDAVSYSDPRFLTDFQWETRDNIVVCKYSQKEWFPLRIMLLSNDMIVTEDEWEEIQKQNEEVKNRMRDSIVVKDIVLNDLPTVRVDRKTQDYIINQYLLTQNRIIDVDRWPSRHLPLIYQDGDSHWIEGQFYTRSYVQDSKDAQRFVNYVGSEIATEIKNRRREQWIGSPDNIQGYEQFWRNPELQAGILLAKPDPKTGQMPAKQAPSEIPQSLLLQYQRGSQDIREIMGISENMNLEGKDMSGKARRERKMEGSMAAYVYFDNANQAIEQSGRVILDLLPHIIGDNERHMILSKTDGKTQSVILNQQVNGQVVNKIVKGDYDVEIDTGPSFAVQKDIALEFFQQTIANNPQIFPLIADLWASQLDVEQMPTIKERLKILVPPQILAKEEGKQLPPQPPSPQEQMMQMEMQAKQADIQEKMQKIQIDLEKLAIEKAKLQLEAQKSQNQMSLDVFNHQTDLERSRIDHHMDVAKTRLAHTENMASVLADLHKHHTQR